MEQTKDNWGRFYLFKKSNFMSQKNHTTQTLLTYNNTKDNTTLTYLQQKQ